MIKFDVFLHKTMNDLLITELKEAVSDSCIVTVSKRFDGFSQQLIQKKNTTLQVWRYFGFVPDSNGQPKINDAPMYKLTVLIVYENRLWPHFHTTGNENENYNLHKSKKIFAQRN